MTKQQITQEVATSKWQPQFQLTDDLDAVIDSILKPHEDYVLGLHGIVGHLIDQLVGRHYREDITNIDFSELCQLQNILFSEKLDKSKEMNVSLPNMYINLGLRQSNVKVRDWNCPSPLFLEELKEVCFPISCDFEKVPRENAFCYYDRLKLGNKSFYESSYIEVIYDSQYNYHLKYDRNAYEIELLELLTDWYKTFQTIHFFEDLNERIAGIVINVLSKILINKYLIK